MPGSPEPHTEAVVERIEPESAPPEPESAPPEPARSEEEKAAPALRLFVRAARNTRRPLELLRLDSWGDTLLGTKLRGELATGYAILLVVCVFEVLAWTLLFNYFFQAGQMRVSYATVAAAFLGLLWGMGIFTIDKNLITSDLRRAGWRKYKGALARILMVMGAALLTAQPLEQLVFRSVVEEHLKQELLREEAVKYAQQLQDLERQRGQIDKRRPDNELPTWVNDNVEKRTGDNDRLKNELDESIVRENQAEQAVQRAEEKLARARWALTQARQQDPDSAETVAAKERLDRVSSALRAATDELDIARARKAALDDRLSRSAAELDKAERERKGEIKEISIVLEKERDELKEKEQSYRHFLRELSNTPYGEALDREDGTAFRWKIAGAIERMGALGSIRDATAPRWPLAGPDLSRQAAELAGLGNDFSRSLQGGTELSLLWWLVVLVGAAIPALSIFYKLTMSEELKTYYSVEAQAHAGNPEAVALLRARSALPPHDETVLNALRWLARTARAPLRALASSGAS